MYHQNCADIYLQREQRSKKERESETLKAESEDMLLGGFWKKQEAVSQAPLQRTYGLKACLLRL